MRTALRATGADTLSASMYNFMIGLTLLWGLGLNVVMLDVVPLETLQSIPTWLFLVGYFVMALTGIFLNVSSSNPAVSFLGYNLVVVPLGLLLCLAIPGFEQSAIQMAVIQTGMAVILMVLGATLFPKLALSLGPFLFMALLGLIIAQLVSIFVFDTMPTVLNVIGVGIFCGYLAYDWASAQSADKTLDNAIDAACALYLDIINLFMHLLKLSSSD